MKNNYKVTVFFLLFYTAEVLLLTNGQLIGVHWSFSEKTAFGRMLLHPELVQVHLLFSASLLCLLLLKNEKTYKPIFGIALAASIYGSYISYHFMIGIDLSLMLVAGQVIQYSAPLAFQGVFSIFAKPIHRADEDGK
ncbi:hypothetical protein ACO0LG_16075 [Undibacterium sp. Ji42W]|uniref:hypothetical protein n=1 Tax=Undibacterium sp. Ji42W TaxID=3413039 RepID=UPI003BF05F35